MTSSFEIKLTVSQMVENPDNPGEVGLIFDGGEYSIIPSSAIVKEPSGPQTFGSDNFATRMKQLAAMRHEPPAAPPQQAPQAPTPALINQAFAEAQTAAAKKEELARSGVQVNEGRSADNPTREEFLQYIQFLSYPGDQQQQQTLIERLSHMPMPVLNKYVDITPDEIRKYIYTLKVQRLPRNTGNYVPVELSAYYNGQAPGQHDPNNPAHKYGTGA